MHDFKKYTPEEFLADESFVNYLLEKNSDDIIFWKTWISENPGCMKEVQDARNLFFIIRQQRGANVENERSDEINKHYSAFRSLLSTSDFNADAEGKTLVDVSLKEAKKNNFRRILLYAASIAAIFLCVVSVRLYFKQLHGSAGEEEYILVAKTINNTKEISLPDGSVAQLNDNSTIKIATDYNRNKREVLLTGSAYFEVQKNPSKPFIVTAGATKTTALGTAFYVHSLRNKSTSVSLVEGKVKVEGNKNRVELIPGEKAVYNSGQSLVKGSFNLGQFLLWRKGEIRFEHARWAEIKMVIEEYFNKEVLVKGTIPKANFTGSFKAQKIETILDALSFTYNLEYKLDDQHIVIAFK